LSTTNVSSQSNQIEMSSLHGYLVAWGDEAVYDIHAEFSFDVSTDELALNIFSLPGKSIDQDVVFTELSDQVGTIGDLVGNLWGTIDYNEPLKEVAYTARVHRFHLPGDAEFVSTPLQGPDIPADLGQLTSDSDPVTKLRYVYNYIVDKYAPNLDNADLKFAPETDDIAAKESLHSIEYAYLLAAYAQKLEIPTRICYGYLMGVDSLGGFDAGVPIVYVQALVDGEVATLDPFLEDVTGFEMFAAPFFDRIQMGVLNPSNQFDSVLGMLTSTTLSRPQVTEIGNINQSFDYTLAVDFPPEVLSGNYYQGTLTISNDSGHVIELESVLLNNKDYLSSIVGISDNYYRLIRPVGETRLVLTGLIEEDLFSSNSRSGKVTVKPLDPVFPTKTESYTVSFKANIQLVLGLISGAVVLTLLVGFWYYKKGLRKRRLTKSYAMEQDMVPTPILEG
ncbi:transglutaminase domain-containing protein, partial [Candidatus Dojkabacteria bacterium]|nr:transglutaminase domain-containing protein [Candidatus Dojkabacteria bacterium]